MNDTTEAGAGTGSAGGDLPVVYHLSPDCTRDDIQVGERYLAEVNGIVEYGVFVDCSDNVSGLVHESELEKTPEVGDEIVVTLLEIRESGDLAFGQSPIDEYEVIDRVHSYDRAGVSGLGTRIGEEIHLEGEVVQVRQTSGPTIFRIRDETGIIQCAAFEGAGVRSHPEIERGALVHVAGEVESREGTIQVEVDALEHLPAESAEETRLRLEAALEAGASPHDPEPLVEWDAMEKVWPELQRVANLLRRAVIEARPIRIRHHADGDGMRAAVPVQRA
ncbi:MAG: OB-fold nucleic acid binding domain-containing protein, partial [Halobacteriaceae archaeon]